MADDLDAMLKGNDAPADSQSGTNQQDDSIQRIEQQTEEEVEFNKLSGSSQDRFKEIIREKNRLAAELAAKPSFVPPSPSSIAPDQKQALETLANFGVATDEKVDKKIAEGVNQIRWELKNANLSQKYTGSNGEPKYDPTEVEDYMRTHPQYQYYDPEDVFKYKMFPDEFSSVGNQTTQKPRTQSLRPTKAQTRQDALTPEFIEERLKQSDGDAWYEANKDEINKVVYNHTQQFKGTNFGGQ